jgi:hypothetical protein
MEEEEEERVLREVVVNPVPHTAQTVRGASYLGNLLALLALEAESDLKHDDPPLELAECEESESERDEVPG